MTGGGLKATDPKGATKLAILGVVCRAPALASEIAVLVKHIVGRAWQPTMDVIGINVNELIQAGLLVREGSERTPETTRYSITPDGRDQLDSLLRDPVQPSPAGLDEAAISLKVCFLDLLEPAAQREQIDAILHLYENEITHLDHAVRRCACEWTYVPGWIALERDRLSAERAWFTGIRGTLDVAARAAAPAAE